VALIPPIRGRAAVAYAHDIVMAVLSFVLSLYLRLGDGMFFYSRGIVVEGTAVFTAIAAGVFLFMGLYRGLWRYASLSDLVAITRAVSLTVLLFLMFMFLWTRLEDLPRSLVVINWFVLMALLGGPRFLYRLAKDRRFAWREAGDGRARVPILLVGAGDIAELFIRALGRTPDANYRVLGIVADRSNQIGSHIHGIEVMGPIDDLDHVVRALATAGVPAAPVNTVADMVADPQVQAREMFVEIEHPTYGPLKTTGTPLKLSETPGRIRWLAPMPGEHNEEVFVGLLGHSRDDLARWQAEGVI